MEEVTLIKGDHAMESSAFVIYKEINKAKTLNGVTHSLGTLGELIFTSAKEIDQKMFTSGNSTDPQKIGFENYDNYRVQFSMARNHSQDILRRYNQSLYQVN